MTLGLLEALTVELGVGYHDLQRVIQSAPRRYKVYSIPKRNGGRRMIAQPSRELKAIQRVILRDFLSDLPIHNDAMAYREGVGIADNAKRHQGNRVILKLDFTAFFPSIRVADWDGYVRRNKIKLDRSEKASLRRILFWGNGEREPVCLSIGAPTSPAVSNIIMYDLDVLFSEHASRMDLAYTRYADDITVSGSSFEDLLLYEKRLRKIISSTNSPKLRINEEKRGLYASGQRRMVTGLILTPDGKVSIGRDRKRQISSLVNKVVTGEATPSQLEEIKGLIAFAISAEPGFVETMRRKYGDQTVETILRYEIPRGGFDRILNRALRFLD